MTIGRATTVATEKAHVSARSTRLALSDTKPFPTTLGNCLSISSKAATRQISAFMTPIGLHAFFAETPKAYDLGEFVDGDFGNWVQAKLEKRRMINIGNQPSIPANVRAYSKGVTALRLPLEDPEIRLDSEMGEHAAALKTTVHFEKSDEESIIFNRVAGMVRGQEIHRARTKEDVYKLLLTTRHSQIVINCSSCGREGFQLLEDLREISQLNDIPIVVVSDRGDEATIRLAFALGATRFFVKPSLLDDYKRCIAGILSEARVLDEGRTSFEKFSHSESSVPTRPSRPPKPFQTCSLVTEKQPLKRYPWVYNGT